MLYLEIINRWTPWTCFFLKKKTSWPCKAKDNGQQNPLIFAMLHFGAGIGVKISTPGLFSLGADPATFSSPLNSAFIEENADRSAP